MKSSLTLILAFVALVAFGQTANVPTNIRATNTLDGLADGGLGTSELLYGIPMAPGDIIGDEFLNENWRKSVVTLSGNGKKVEGYNCRYNIVSNELYFQSRTGEVRAVKGSKIKSFTLVDGNTDMVSEFVNANKFLIDGAPLDGFVQVIVDGKTPLYKYTEMEVIKPNYRPEFDMGSKDTKLVKKSTYYRAEGANLIKLNVSGKKKLAKSLGDQQSKMNTYTESFDSFDPGNEIHLADFFRYLNK